MYYTGITGIWISTDCDRVRCRYQSRRIGALLKLTTSGDSWHLPICSSFSDAISHWEWSPMLWSMVFCPSKFRSRPWCRKAQPPNFCQWIVYFGKTFRILEETMVLSNRKRGSKIKSWFLPSLNSGIAASMLASILPQNSELHTHTHTKKKYHALNINIKIITSNILAQTPQNHPFTTFFYQHQPPRSPRDLGQTCYPNNPRCLPSFSSLK